MKKKLSVLFLCLLLLLCSCEHGKTSETETPLPDDLPQMEICFFDVGKADFMLITCGDAGMIIDAGYKSSKSKIKDELKERGVKNVDIAVATHNHKDHIGSMAFVIEKYNVKTLYMSRIGSGNDFYGDMTESASLRGCNVIEAADGMTFSLGYAKFKVLSPGSMLAGQGDENEASIVLRMDYGSVSVLFMADALERTENVLLSTHGGELGVDVIKIGHHATEETCSSSFLKKTGAKYAVISTGDGQPPSDKALSNIAACGMKLYRTDTDGDIIMTTDGKTIEFKTSGKE